MQVWIAFWAAQKRRQQHRDMEGRARTHGRAMSWTLGNNNDNNDKVRTEII